MLDGDALLVEILGVDLPKNNEWVDLVEEWYTWTNTYYSLIGYNENLEELLDKSRNALQRWGRIKNDLGKNFGPAQPFEQSGW